MSSTSQLIRRLPNSRWDSEVVAEGEGADHEGAFLAVFADAKFDDRIYVCDDLETSVVHTHYEVKNSSGGNNELTPYVLSESRVIKEGR